MRLLLCAAFVLLLAGCDAPPHEASPEPTPSFTAAPAPTYEATIVVTEETPSGKPMQAVVQAFPRLASGGIGNGLAQGTDTQGAARFSFHEPTTLLVRVLGPKGWTQEGATVHIGSAVAAEGVTVSDHDVFIPLFHERLALEVSHTWSTATAQANPDGSRTPARTVVPLALPTGLELAYLQRLSDAAVQATWMDGTQGHAATLAAGFAWDGAPWVVGEETSPFELGSRSATWDGDIPADRPVDLGNAHLQAMLATSTAVVGDILVDLDVGLAFGGLVPAGLPPASCPGHLLQRAVPC
jgi:hypothetical protein